MRTVDAIVASRRFRLDLGWCCSRRAQGLDAGPITITLISPTRTGRRAIPDQQPRLTQLVFGVEESGVSQVITGLRSLGLAVEDGDGGRPYIPPAVAEGVLGWRAALVVTPLSPADEAADDEGGQTGPRG